MKVIVSKNPYFWITVCLLSMKTYIITKYFFELNIETNIQELILILSTVGSSLLLVLLSFVVKGEKRISFSLVIYIIVTCILYTNVLYYRFFNDFITLPVLLQTKNINKLTRSIVELFQWYDFLFFLDVFLLFFFYRKKKQIRSAFTVNPRVVLAIAIPTLFLNLFLAHQERPELLTRSFDRKLLVKNLGIYSYHLYDLIVYTNTKRKIVLADNDDVSEIINYVKANRQETNENYFGYAKGKNLFLISLESTQSFVLNKTIDGQEITPFLNSLIRQNGTYHFTNFYHQTGQGKTSDSEFIVENSLYGLPRGAVFFSNPENKYETMASILNKKAGYYSAVFHANNSSFWNRDVIYKAFGYNRFFSDVDYDITRSNSIGWGLKDDSFFKQSITHLQSLPQPFYAKFITLTNHFPFTLSKSDEYIPEWNSKDGTVNRYFTTVRYQDEALKQFFSELKKVGLYDNSIFILYGDHYGISENHNKAMSEFLQKEITSFEFLQLQRVPLIIHFPNKKEKKEIDTVSGQIDLKPTLLNLLGVDNENDIQFGSDLFANNRENFVILRDGSFITSEYVMTGNKCYNKHSGEIIELQYCKPYIQAVRNELGYSDKIIYGDLLRFIQLD